MVAPPFPSQLDPARMPRMCPELARLRMALYQVAKQMRIVEQPTARQFYEMEEERKTEEYQAASRALAEHLASCEICREKTK